MPDVPHAWRHGFDEVAELYDQVRPGYPDEFFHELAALLPRSPVVVEVGPGTGQATKGLVARGAKLTAVELGAHLATVLARNLPTVDAVVAASSYHWVPPEERVTRPATLLRPGGYLAVIALNQVASPADSGSSTRSITPSADMDCRQHTTLSPHTRDWFPSLSTTSSSHRTSQSLVSIATDGTSATPLGSKSR